MRIDQDLPKMDQWICHTHGGYVLDVERKVLSGVLADYFGYHIVQVGGPTHDSYIADSLIRHKVRLSVDQCNSFDGDNMQADLYQFPFKADSVDVMVMPHVLEYVAEPDRVLKNCYDSLVSGGHLILLSFNPYSLMGVAKLFGKNDRVFRRAQFITPYNMRKYLHSAGFVIKEYKSMCFRMPVKNKQWFERLKIIEPIGRFIWPSLGGVYMMVVQKEVVPVDLIGLDKSNEKVRVRTGVVEPTASKVRVENES